MSAGQERLILKWGSIKGWWNITPAKSKDAVRRWCSGSVAYSAMFDGDTPEQKAAVCDLIDCLDGTITNDWSGETMSKDEAKRYIMDYEDDDA